MAPSASAIEAKTLNQSLSWCQDFAMSRGPVKQFDPDQALHQAMKGFWAKGHVGSGLNELLEAMGISRKSLYDTFCGSSKRELFGNL